MDEAPETELRSRSGMRICYPGFLSPVGSAAYEEWAKTIREHKFVTVSSRATNG